MFRVADRVSVEEIRQINLSQWKLGPESYFGRTPYWVRPEGEILRGIQNPTHDVQELLDAVPGYEVTTAGLQACWAHHMAVHAGCHPWPNANHRTAMRAYNLALDRAQGWHAGFADPGRGHDLVFESHGQRDADGGEYRVAELQDESHPYRRLFSGYSRELVIVPAVEAGQFADFAEGTSRRT